MQPYDMPISQLQNYRPDLTAQDDVLRQFWDDGLRHVTDLPWNDCLERVDYPALGVRLFAVTLDGVDGAPLHGWYAYSEHGGARPGLVTFHGYNGRYENGIHDVVNWALHGYAALALATRGQQGSGERIQGIHGHPAGWMTQNILDPEAYYFRWVYLDAVRILEWFQTLAEVDSSRIGITGGSQGGGITLAAAALSSVPSVAVADYPFLCHFGRAVDIAPAGPYGEISEFLRQNGDPETETQVWHTLSLHDAMNLAPWIRIPVLVSSGLIDQLTPPSTIFAAYNHMASDDRAIRVYRYFGHEAIPRFHTEKLAWLLNRLHKRAD